MCKNIFQDGGSILRNPMTNEQRERKALQELLLSGPYSRSQLFLSETLARLHPELTMPMFSGRFSILISTTLKDIFFDLSHLHVSMKQWGTPLITLC